MSEEKTVETGTEGAETDPAKIWAELQEQEAGQVIDPPAGSEAGTEAGKGQGESSPDESAASSEKPAEQADDLWKDAPPALREAYLAEKGRADQAEAVVRTHSGRLSKADQELNTLRAELDRVKGGGEEDKKSLLSDEEKARIREEFGDSIGPVLDYTEALEAKIDKLSGAQAAQVETQTETVLQDQLKIVSEAVPTWQDDISTVDEATGQRKVTQEWTDWVMRQPGFIQDAVVANARQIVDGASAAYVIGMFRREVIEPRSGNRERQEERRKDQMDALRDPSVKIPSATATQETQDRQRIWAELEAEDRRRASGR